MALITFAFALLAAAPAAAAAPKPLLRVALKQCTVALQQADRSATFVGSMPLVKGARRMEMRFDLQQRVPGDRFVRVAVPKWGVWERSQPRVPSFSFERRVEQLAAPADYRAVVRFRWYNASRKIVRRATRHSATCREPDPRPDLAVGTVTAVRTDPGQARYDVIVRNDGRSDVLTPFDLELSAKGDVLGAASAPSLAAGASTTISIVAAACKPGERLQLHVDSGGTVEEASERNNAAGRDCPLAAAK